MENTHTHTARKVVYFQLVVALGKMYGSAPCLKVCFRLDGRVCSSNKGRALKHANRAVLVNKLSQYTPLGCMPFHKHKQLLWKVRDRNINYSKLHQKKKVCNTSIC